MQIVQIWGEAQSFNSTLDVLLDVGGGVGDAAISENIEAAFRGDCG